VTIDIFQFAIIFACLAAGGILKGATGAGAPVIAVPALAMMFDVRFAIIIMLMPNLLTNAWQAWRLREERPAGGFAWRFGFAGMIGVVAGTVVLVAFSAEALQLLMAAVVFLYIGLRLAKPHWGLDFSLARKLSLPVGTAAGFLQGATGVSAPISLTFLNAVRLDRLAFIATVSVFFSMMTAPQVVMLGYLGFLTWQNLALSLAAMLPILAFMPVGQALAARLSKDAFDKIMLGFLAALSIKLVWDALAAGVA
jgi:uncharacterized protein